MIAVGTMPSLDTLLKAPQPLMIPVGRYDNCHVVEVNCDVQPVCEEPYLQRRRKTAPRNWLRSGFHLMKIQLARSQVVGIDADLSGLRNA
jgi:hypothetical protein